MSEIYGFRVGSTTYEYDYGHLANKPPAIPAWDCGDAGKALGLDSNGSLSWVEIPDGLPAYSNSDAGKALAVDSNGGLCWMEIPALPSVEGETEGSVLMVVSDNGANEAQWAELLPSYSNADDGKVLTVNGSGHLEWKAVGGSYGGDHGYTDTGQPL